MTESAGFRDPKVLLPFILVTLIWSSTWIVIKDQLGSVPHTWSVSYRFLIAGGETSGAVVKALGVDALSIGPEIDPGVPWTRSLSQPDVALALKSGNFGAPDFFTKAWERLA